jgi:hypothetical protein
LGDSASKAEDDACESQLPSLQTLTWDLSRHSWSLELGRSYQPSASAIDSLVIMIDGGQQLSRRRDGHGGPLVGDREFRRSAHPIDTSSSSGHFAIVEIHRFGHRSPYDGHRATGVRELALPTDSFFGGGV